jgi:hypothetical protein
VTSSRQFTPPPTWDDETLEVYRRQAIADFVRERTEEGARPYREAFAKNLGIVRELFRQTSDLLDLGTGATLATQPELLPSVRYLSGPPVSADDLNTLVGSRVSARKRLDPELARLAATIVEAVLDQERFPWMFVSPRRAPTAAERDLAYRWTAGLQTVEQIKTTRRGDSSRKQERAVGDLLRGHGFTGVRPRPISLLDDLARGEFSRESLVAGTKCDVPVRLRDGRLLLIECKVSNSETNSVKRLNRECGGKSRVWLAAFGPQAIPAAVLAGVFKLKNLSDAQRSDHVTIFTIFWEGDLTALGEFLDAAA